jgi:hypothetical protein
MKVVSWYVSDQDFQAIRLRVAKLGITRQQWLTNVVQNAINEEVETQERRIPLNLPTDSEIDKALAVLKEVTNALMINREIVCVNFLLKLLEGKLTLADLNKTARVLDVDPGDLQKIKKSNGENKQNVSNRTS